MWLALSGPREIKARQYDAAAAAAFQSNDLNRAYRQAQFAAAFKRTDERSLEMASLAFLRQQYSEAYDEFNRINDQSALRVPARSGALLAAARMNNHSAYQSAQKRHSDESVRSKKIVARAALDADDRKTLSQTCLCGSREADLAYLVAMGQAVDSPSEAINTLTAGASPSDDKAAKKISPTFDKLVNEVLHVSAGTRQDLAVTLTAVAGTRSLATRQALLANHFLKQSDTRVARHFADKAVHLETDYRDGWNVLAAIQIADGEFNEAERSLKISLDLDPAYAPTWLLKARLAKAQNDSGREKEFRAKAKLLNSAA